MFPMPCPHCQQVPDPMDGKTPNDIWAIFCNCTEHGQGCTGYGRDGVVKEWNELVEKIITGKIDSETLEEIK